ncbi:MAG: glycosyltransferase family 4 protein [bacterium]|nr:glycosyltransferase family 4 protein [bacterium]
MKIAQIVCAFPPYAGGIGQSAYRLGQILSREHAISTYTLAAKEQKIPQAMIGDQKIIYLRPRLRAGHGAFPFSLLFRLTSFDTIYLHYPFFGVDAIIFLLCSLRKSQRLIIHYHMDTPALPGLKRFLALPSRIFFFRLMKRAEKIIVSSRDYAQHSDLKKIMELYPAKIKAVPFGVETDVFHPKMSASEDAISSRATAIVDFVTRRFIKRGGHTILFVGGLDSAHYFKGLSNLIKALPMVKSAVTLHIVGDGDLRAQYEAEAKAAGVTRHVRFLGRISEDDLIRQYQSADLLVLPSINTHEAFGLVLIEAMACGLPVIASNLPGVRSVFNDGVEGYVVEPGNIIELAEKINLITADENKRKEMARAARTLAKEKYGWEKIADQILDEFSAVK